MATVRPGDFYGQGSTMLYHPIDQQGNVPAFAQRSDCMMLDTVQRKDVPRGQVWHYKDHAQALNTTDLEGAAPTYKYKRFHAECPAEKDHITGTAAKTCYPDIRRPVDLSLSTMDIDKSRPNVQKFVTPRCVDPIAPNYTLPSVSHRPLTPRKQKLHEGQIWDSMEHTDKCKPLYPQRNQYRNPNEGRDIAYAQPNFRRMARPLGASGIRDIMKTSDILGEKNLTMTKNSGRCSNPLDPEYKMCTKTTHPMITSEPHCPYAPAVQGAVDGASPRVLTRDNGEPQTSLIKEDILGAAPQRYKGCLPFNIYDPPEVTPYSKSHGCQDIEGANPGTRKGGPAR